MRKGTFLLLTLLLAACNLLSPTALPATATDTLTATVPPSPTPITDTPYQPCAYQWDSRSLPELSAKVQDAIQTAGLTGVTASAVAFGESCSTGRPDETPSFGAMETDYHLTVQVDDLADREALGNLVERILAVLDQFPAGTTPGPNPGYVGISFTHANDQLNLWFSSQDGKADRDEGLHGAALLEKLLNQ